MIIRMPDNPTLISLEMLKRLDADEPHTWLCQPKCDGWRRTIWHEPKTGQWTYMGKGAGAKRDLPASLRVEFENIAWPPGIALDCEWTGPRCVNWITEDVLNVFDLLACASECTDWTVQEWYGKHPFRIRYRWLEQIMAKRTTAHVKLVPCWPNPGMVDRFMGQMQDPLSEGLVIRRADSQLIGNISAPATNPFWFKCKYREAPKEL